MLGFLPTCGGWWARRREEDPTQADCFVNLKLFGATGSQLAFLVLDWMLILRAVPFCRVGVEDRTTITVAAEPTLLIERGQLMVQVLNTGGEENDTRDLELNFEPCGRIGFGKQKGKRLTENMYDAPGYCSKVCEEKKSNQCLREVQFLKGIVMLAGSQCSLGPEPLITFQTCDE